MNGPAVDDPIASAGFRDGLGCAARTRAAAGARPHGRLDALLLGWVVLGALGRQWVPLWVGGLAPVAVWLATIGAALALGQRRTLSGPALRGTVTGCGAAAALGCVLLPTGGQPVASFQTTGSAAIASVLGVALAWGLLLVAASRVVQGLRQASRAAWHPTPHPGAWTMSPARPALAAALAVSGLLGLGGVGLLLPPALLASVLGVSGVLLAGLAATRDRSTGCHSGLFDCALPFSAARSAAGGRAGPVAPRPAEPQGTAGAAEPAMAVAATRFALTLDIGACARLTMLPMMASLALMLELCVGPGGPPVALLAFAHLVAMVLPAVVLGLPAGAEWVGPQRRLALAGLALLAGGGVLLKGFQLSHWMAASLLHALAWGLAWSARLDGRSTGASSREDRAPRRAAIATMPARAAFPALAVLAMGAGVQLGGPAVLMALHLAIAGLAASVALTALARQGRRRAEARAPRVERPAR